MPLDPSPELARVIVESSADGIVVVDPGGIVLSCNPAAEALLGRPAAELIGEEFGRPVPSDPEQSSSEILVPQADGSPRTVELRAADALWDEDSVSVVVLRDVTERKRAERALRERVKEVRTLYAAQRELARTDRSLEDRLEHLVELLPPGWLHPDLTEARIIYDGATFATAGFRESPWILTQPVVAGDRIAGRIEVVLVERPPAADGDDSPFLREERELLEGLATAVSEAIQRDELRREFVQAQKMETIGRLAGGIAHDFNNMMTVIQGIGEMVLEDLPLDHPQRKDIEEILTASRRAAGLTGQLLAFSRRETLLEELFDLRRAVDEVKPMLRRLIPERIDLRFDLDPVPVPVRADRSKLHQSLLNLVVNAKDAIEREGLIRIGVEASVPDDHAPTREGAEESESVGYAVLTVSDDGAGMEPEVRDRLFEPFFTTKPVGKGTGLGLSVVYGFVTQTGGRVEVESEEGEGSTFRILLPRAREESGEELGPGTAEGDARSPWADPHAGTPRGTVLLVEDDRAVRRVTARMFQRAGFEVVEAGDGAEAISLVEGYEGRIDLVLSDVVMPGMSGREVMERLQEKHPDLKIVLTSGYSEEELTPDVKEKATAFLPKPFSPEALGRLLREIEER